MTEEVRYSLDPRQITRGFGRMRARHNDRMLDREAQTRGWAAPLPDFSVMPRTTETGKMRVEWDTRDTINNRMWTDIQTAGPKAVTATMLSAHPTGGAQTTMPTASRQDHRNWSSQPYFPDPKHPGERPTLPPSSLFQNPAMIGVDPEGRDAVRELRGAVKEDTRWWGEDTSSRIVSHVFQHQWVAPSVTSAQLDAAERLRPGQDDYRKQYH
jgi:hypothetical protein